MNRLTRGLCGVVFLDEKEECCNVQLNLVLGLILGPPTLMIFFTSVCSCWHWLKILNGTEIGWLYASCTVRAKHNGYSWKDRLK